MITLARLLGVGGGLFLGIILHEYAHAKTADLLGDKYPRFQGRMTLKPKAHADPIGTIAMPLLFLIVSLVGQPFKMVFGYGKPMEYNPRSLRKPKRDQILIAAAGPAVNLLLALAAGLGASALYRPGLVRGSGTETLLHALVLVMSVNVFILIINAIPIPPLDGAKILSMFLSPGAVYKMQEYAQYLILFLIVLFLFLQGVLSAIAEPLCATFSANLVASCPLQ